MPRPREKAFLPLLIPRLSSASSERCQQYASGACWEKKKLRHSSSWSWKRIINIKEKQIKKIRNFHLKKWGGSKSFKRASLKVAKECSHHFLATQLSDTCLLRTDMTCLILVKEFSGAKWQEKGNCVHTDVSEFSSLCSFFSFLFLSPTLSRNSFSEVQSGKVGHHQLQFEP